MITTLFNHPNLQLISRFMKNTFFYIPMLMAVLFLLACGNKKEITAQDYDPSLLRPEIVTLADEIFNDNYIGTELMGRMPQTAPAYTRRLRLMSEATPEELRVLTYHPGTIVQLVAFEGLYENGDPAVPVILDRFTSNPELIQYIKGDISQEIPMLEYAYVYVMRFTLPGESVPGHLEPAMPAFTLTDYQHQAVQGRIQKLRSQG